MIRMNSAGWRFVMMTVGWRFATRKAGWRSAMRTVGSRLAMTAGLQMARSDSVPSSLRNAVSSTPNDLVSMPTG